MFMQNKVGDARSIDKVGMPHVNKVGEQRGKGMMTSISITGHVSQLSVEHTDRAVVRKGLHSRHLAKR